MPKRLSNAIRLNEMRMSRAWMALLKWFAFSVTLICLSRKPIPLRAAHGLDFSVRKFAIHARSGGTRTSYLSTRRPAVGGGVASPRSR